MDGARTNVQYLFIKKYSEQLKGNAKLHITDVQCVASFVSRESAQSKAYTELACQGNYHIVISLKSWKDFSKPGIFTLTQELPDYIFVFWMASHPIQARFFQNGFEIQRCGSGSVALARLYFKLERKNSSESKTRNHAAIIKTPFSNSAIGFDQLGLYYKAQMLASKHTRKRRWENLIDKPIHSCFQLGTAGDYCVLVCKDENAVKNCHIKRDKLLCLSSRCSLIVTAPST